MRDRREGGRVAVREGGREGLWLCVRHVLLCDVMC